MEAASDLVKSSWQRSETPNKSAPKKTMAVDPLSRIAGHYQSKSLNPKERADSVPPFLRGEVYSFEDQTAFDDNISALSAYTLEEMARKAGAASTGPTFRDPMRNPPSPVRTSSSSSTSQQGKSHYSLEHEHTMLKSSKAKARGKHRRKRRC